MVNIARQKPGKFARKMSAKVRYQVSFQQNMSLPETQADGKREATHYKLGSLCSVGAAFLRN